MPPLVSIASSPASASVATVSIDSAIPSPPSTASVIPSFTKTG
jgi:hypothetical protein